MKRMIASLIGVCAFLCVNAAAGDSPNGTTSTASAHGVGVHRGHLVHFEIVDGWAIAEGDIILGRADELAAALTAPRASDMQPKGFTMDRPSGLWPRGPSG